MIFAFIKWAWSSVTESRNLLIAWSKHVFIPSYLFFFGAPVRIFFISACIHWYFFDSKVNLVWIATMRFWITIAPFPLLFSIRIAAPRPRIPRLWVSHAAFMHHFRAFYRSPPFITSSKMLHPCNYKLFGYFAVTLIWQTRYFSDYFPITFCLPIIYLYLTSHLPSIYLALPSVTLCIPAIYLRLSLIAFLRKLTLLLIFRCSNWTQSSIGERKVHLATTKFIPRCILTMRDKQVLVRHGSPSPADQAPLKGLQSIRQSATLWGLLSPVRKLKWHTKKEWVLMVRIAFFLFSVWHGEHEEAISSK